MKHGRYPSILALLAVSLLLAVAGCAGPRAGAVSHVSSPASTPAIPTTVPPAVLKTALPSKHLPPTTPPPSPSPSCGSGRAAGTVVLDLPGGRRALLAVPAGDDGHHRLGLVIGLPGYGRTSEELAAQSRIPARAMAAGVLAVLPQGAGPPSPGTSPAPPAMTMWGSCPHWSRSWLPPNAPILPAS